MAASDATLPAGSSARTLEFWIDTRGCCATTSVLSYGSSTNGFSVGVGGNTVTVAGDSGSSISIPTATNPEVGWNLVDVTYNGTTATAYVDGQNQGEGPVTANTAVPGNGLALAGGNWDFADVAVYPTALTAEQVADNYDAALAAQEPPPGGALTQADLNGGGSPSEVCVPCSLDNSSSPVTYSTGNFWHTIDDLSVPGRGVPLDFSQTYNSSAASTDGPLGFGWTDNYAMSLAFGGSGDITVNEEGGSAVTFDPSGAGFASAAPRIMATLVKNAGERIMGTNALVFGLGVIALGGVAYPLARRFGRT